MSGNYQEKFWRELDQLRIHATYIEGYYEKTAQTDRIISMLLAVTSSGGIAGWAVWSEYQYVWAFLVAASQVVNAVKGYLPYSKRLKALSTLSAELESLFLSMENHWFNVSEARLNNEEIHKLHMKIKEQRRLIIQKNIGSIDLPHKKNLMDEATKSARQYFENFYMFEE
ncbi:hypothetical protein SAMN02745857_00956 [Andreprevotia lacus DSM 23236]|uniref:SMODS and SLOG-associating 2TM effector domain-containing protein n=1 Tax=Andreprevotia lacus DSM 23236 TaxID=1121001 RepID=A0A1W1X9S9_9NEIS|nr:hypothetical protein [Andreprevotia lacus]SMC20428.1 hypothetical protein SAMN02745857_00956 [Andreprevotia lacus DSM 23236]